MYNTEKLLVDQAYKLQQWALNNHTLFLLAAGVENTRAAISIAMFSLIGSWRLPAIRISSNT